MPNDTDNHYFPSSDGTPLFFERTGSGPPLVLCDGLLCEGHVWKYFTEEFKRDFELIHWNYPGHGASREPPGGADLSVARMGEDLLCLAAHLELGKCVLVGHSYGVQVALEACRVGPQNVSGMVLLCGSATNLLEHFGKGGVLPTLIPLLEFGASFVPRPMSKIWRAIPFNKLNWLARATGEVNSRLMSTRDLAEYLSRLNRVDFKVALRMVEAAGRHGALQYLDQLDVPTLVMGAQNDSFTPPRLSRVMADGIPHSELEMVAGATHSLPIERPDLVHLRVRRFLSERIGL